MVEAVPSQRDQIRDELLILALEHINNWDQYSDREYRNSESGYDFVSRQTDY